MVTKDAEVSKDKEFEYVTSQIIRHIDRSVDAFKLFAQLFSLIVGGAIWLSIQSSVKCGANLTYARVSDGLVVLVTLITSLMVFEDYRAWRNFRTAQSKLVPHVDPPAWRSEITKWAMILCMVAGCALFLRFNPLT